MNIKKELGEKIKRLRKSKNLTQEQLAELIDISSRNLSGIELGINYPKPETLEKIVKALDIDVQEIFSIDYLQSEADLVNYITTSIDYIRHDKSKLELIYKIVKFIRNY